MAPELWKGEKATVASDVYGLGVILYELASGRRPFAPDGAESAAWEERLTRQPPAAHPKWDRILARCLDPDPARRFRDATELAQALEPPRSRRWVLAPAAAVILTVLFGVWAHEYATGSQTLMRFLVRYRNQVA